MERILIKRPALIIVAEMLRDIKSLNNPLYPAPEKIGIAKTWAFFICRGRYRSTCIDPDEIDIANPKSVKRLIELMVDYISEQIEG